MLNNAQDDAVCSDNFRNNGCIIAALQLGT